ncbi:hypothetical protein SxD43FB_10255 [Sphingobium sp. D43FB]|nr:hypothetical protein SxD43FB_10255 [Sphingobium sp. D43FB]
MPVPGNTSPCHHSLHLFGMRRESQHAGIAQQLSDRTLKGTWLNYKTPPTGDAGGVNRTADKWGKIRRLILR